MNRKSHNGPISTEEELVEMLEKLSDETLKRKALIYGVRYRKFTALNIKESNPLFLQNNLDNAKLEANLRLLMQKCPLTLTSAVTMEDLQKVILEDSDETSFQNIEQLPNVETAADDDTVDLPEEPSDAGNAREESHVSIGWPPLIDDHIVVNFDVGFFIGKVVKHHKTNSDLVYVSYMT